MSPSESLVADPLAAGHAALSNGKWKEARASFEAALASHETAEALEGVAMAAWWLDDSAVTIASRERAYRLYSEDANRAAAARMAISLAWDYVAFRGEPAVSNGWLQRAHRLLEGTGPVPERGWLAVRQGEMAFLLDNDIATARRLASDAREIGSSLADTDLELSALALEGMALASVGQVDEGIRLLDEASAAAVGGDISELWAASRTCCYLITACERVRDFERAAQWSQRMLEFADRWRIPHLFAVCRAHYAGVLVWRGTWDEAETEFETAIAGFDRSRPGLGFEAIVRLAELRRRQGRLDDASALFREVEFHPFAKLGLAAVALDSGNAADAAERADRFLGQLGPENPLQRAAGLELLGRALIALGEGERANQVLTELTEIAENVGTDPLRASALAAAGAAAAADGDFARARAHYEDAIDLFQRSGAPYETARTRIELARVLFASGRREAAVEQAGAAQATTRAMGATRDADAAAVLLRELEPAPGVDAESDLTVREIEVLRLVARGLTNAAIADELVLSEHTIHRHVANILAKLRLPSRAAAAAWGVQRGLV